MSPAVAMGRGSWVVGRSSIHLSCLMPIFIVAPVVVVLVVFVAIPD